MPILLTGRELASKLDITYDNVMYYKSVGIIPVIEIGHRRYVFNLAIVVEALRKHHAAAALAAAAETAAELASSD